jgi:hypothetical protein
MAERRKGCRRTGEGEGEGRNFNRKNALKGLNMNSNGQKPVAKVAVRFAALKGLNKNSQLSTPNLPACWYLSDAKRPKPK